ncbi:MAG TPA: OstA-like protein [Balneolaceae bacterium]|nr:OstA-like protein [Balneolaceae bacterium]
MLSQTNHITTSHFTFNHYAKHLVLLITVLLLTGIVQKVSAQNPVTILQANRIEGGSFQGNRVQKILGNVHLKGKQMEMYCDSAYQFVNKNQIRAYGNIEVDTKSEKIWADSLVYLTDLDFSRLRGRVVIEADSTTLFGNSVDYRFSTKVAHFLDEIRLEDQRGTLLANSGFYYRKADSAEFHGKVQLADSMKYLEGDSLFSNRSSKRYEMYGNVFGNDRQHKSMIAGDYLQADSTGHRLLRGDAWLKNFKSDTTDSAQTDTTHIRAKIIRSEERRSKTDTTQVVHAYQNVRVWSPSFSAVGDTSLYSDSTNTFEIWSNSKAWHKQVQLTGPYIKAKLKNGHIDSLQSYPKPFSVQHDTTIDRLNQITGDSLTAGFKSGNLTQIHVFGNSHLLRFTKNDQDKPDGAIDVTAPDIRIFFSKGKLIRMKATGAVNGSYLPESDDTAKKQLQGFAWDPKLRPRRPQEPMKRRFPPIPKNVFFELPKRYIEHLEKTNPDSPKLSNHKSADE